MTDHQPIARIYGKGLTFPFHLHPHRIHWITWGGDSIFMSGRIMSMAMRTHYPAGNDEPEPIDVTI